MSRITNAFSGRPTGRVVTVLAAATVSAAIAAPMAIGSNEGEPMKGGQRNGTYSSETKVIANNSVFGTRQSNLGGGGGAIYGCRAATGAEGCIEASNLNNGQAFNFRFNGALGGSINTDLAKKDDARPFTTNATGVATGLNADRVDGKDAQQIQDETLAAAKAGTKTTIVTSQGALANQRGFTAAAREAEGKYLVTADADISKCIPQVTVYGTDATPGSNATVEAVSANQIRVRTQSAGTADTNPAPVDRQVALTVTC
ncbi:hypothetical protein [Patulibacter sp.]|uniref:hypothetical protein n=1 Tax=Patulibacter sp. TaxID=1912859 RepID=UPI002726CFBE|nr:hypothetical protein [Patulibacter sp.]MDO9408447.1 hypothetical protein [Patulibacter sp.]